MAEAYFAGGCFWCITPTFYDAGASKVVSGFSGGAENDPVYAEVKAQRTGHRETVQVIYDPEKLSYEALCRAFLVGVDPFDGGGQYIDRGRSYTLAAFYTSKEEKEIITKLLKDLAARSGQEPCVAVEPFTGFYAAQEEHQDFYLKQPERYAEEMRQRQAYADKR